jgi:hypothetical protein
VGATVPQLVASRTAPTVFVGDLDGDGRRDLATRSERVLRLFVQGADGRFEGAPSRVVERTSLTAEEASDPLADETPLLTDLDGDGLADLILVKWGSPEQRTRIDRRVFFARPGLVYPEEADQIIRSEGPIPDFVAEDLDRNGGRDLVVPFIHLAPAQAVKIIAENAIKVQLRFFLMGEGGRYGQDPGKAFARVDRRVGIDYRVDLMSLISDDRRPAGRLNPLITVAPDVNGDGYPDLIADTGADRLAFYWGNAEVAFSRRPDHVVPLESALDYDLLDVNGDGRTDIVTYYSREVRTLREAVSAERTQSLSAGRKRAVPGPHEGGPAAKVLVTR